MVEKKRVPGTRVLVIVLVIVIFVLFRAYLFVLAPLSEMSDGVGKIRPLGSLRRRFGRDPCSMSRVASPFTFLGLGHG